jgi:PAS domain S-box-containing protein
MKNNSKDRDNTIFSPTFRFLVETGSDLIGVIDMKGNYLFVSPSCEHILGYNSEFFIGKNAFEFIHPEDVPSALSSLESLQNQKTVYLEPFRFKNARKEWRWIETIATNQLENSLINGIVVNSRDVTEKKRSAELLRLRELHEQEEIQRRITDAVILAQEQERNIISQELHDNVCQLLTTAKLYLDLLKGREEVVHPLIHDTSDILKLTIDQVREISHALSYSSLEEAPIKDSIKELVNHVNGTLKTAFTLQMNDINESMLSFGLKLSIYRIIQEQVNNILKHAEAENALIRLKQEGRQLHLEITDNGIGFDPSVRKKGVGLKNIRSRADAYAGKLELVSSEGMGCTLRIIFDLCCPNQQ